MFGIEQTSSHKSGNKIYIKLCGAYVDRNISPFTLHKADDTQRTSGYVPDEDGDPNMDRLQGPYTPDHKANTEWYYDLRNDGDIKRALGISGPLQAAGVGQSDGNKDARDA